MDFAIYYSFNDMVIRKAYDDLESCEGNTGTLNTARIWNENWWNVFSKREDEEFGYKPKLYIILGRDKNGVTKLILPLICRTKKLVLLGISINFKVLSICGDYWGATFEDILACDITSDDVCALYDFLEKNIGYDWLWFTHVRQGSMLLGHKYDVVQSACPYMPLNDYDSYVQYRKQRYSKKLKYNTNGLRNKVSKEFGEVVTCYVCGSNEEFPWQDIIDTSNSKLLSGKHSLYQDVDKVKFIKSVVSDMDSEAVLVYLNDECAAYRLLFHYKGWTYDMDAAYNRKFPQGLGIFSYDDSIKKSFDAGAVVHCGGTGVDEYKLKFLNKIMPIYHIMCPGKTWLGRITLPIKLKKLRFSEQHFFSILKERKERYHVF